MIAEPLTAVLNSYFTNSSIPYDAKLSAITVIFKKGERDQIRNYRPISLSNNDIKLLTKVMCEGLKNIWILSLAKTNMHAHAAK